MAWDSSGLPCCRLASASVHRVGTNRELSGAGLSAPGRVHGYAPRGFCKPDRQPCQQVGMQEEYCQFLSWPSVSVTQ